MDKIVIIIHRYVIICIDRMNIDVTPASSSLLSIFFPLSSHVWSITSTESCWYGIYSLILISYIISSLIIILDSISVFFKVNQCTKQTFVLNVDTRKVWIYYNIITVWCIQMIWFDIVDVWVNSYTSTFLILGKKLPAIFSS